MAAAKKTRKKVANARKATRAPAVAAPKKKKIKNAGPFIGTGINGFPQNQGTGWSAQVSEPTTGFINLRWYFISNFRQFLCELYVELGLVQTIVDVPVDDAFRGGVTLKSEQLSEDQLAELSTSLDRENDLVTQAQACKWNRLFGGAGVLILTDQDPTEPLDLEAIGPDTPLKFRAADMWELTWTEQNTDGYDPTIESEDFEYYDYYGIQVHKSRVMRMRGLEAPSFLRPRLRGWGFSVVECLIRSLNQYLKATDLTFEVLDEFKLDIYKIKNLVNTLLGGPGADHAVKSRISQMNYTKNYQNAIVMDAEDEYVQKQLSFAGLSDTMGQIRMQVASDMRMPMIKLFGQQAGGGLGSTGEDEIEVYNSMVESQVRNKVKYDILRMCEIKCQKMFGFVPDDLSLEFKPLRVLSAEQEENVKTQKFNRLMQAKQAGEISKQDFDDACNKGNIFDVTLSGGGEDMDGYEDDTAQVTPEQPLRIGDGSSQEPPKDDPREAVDKPAEPKKAELPTGKQIALIPTKKTNRMRNFIRSLFPPPLDWNPNQEFIDDLNRSRKALADPYKALLKKQNSTEFDRVSYEADGGDAWIDDRRKYFYEVPQNIALWKQCKDQAGAHWQYAVWLYEKRGGKF